MSTLVESLRRLYKSGRIALENVESLLEKGTITQKEYDYIVG